MTSSHASTNYAGWEARAHILLMRVCRQGGDGEQFHRVLLPVVRLRIDDVQSCIHKYAGEGEMEGKDAQTINGSVKAGWQRRHIERILTPAVWLGVDGCTTTSTHTVGWVRMRSLKLLT